MFKNIRKAFAELRRDEEGATLVEYGIALLIAITVGGTLLTSLAEDVNENFEDADTSVTWRSGSGGTTPTTP